MKTTRPSTPLRLLLAAIVVIVLGGLAITLVQLTDTALSVSERLQKLPLLVAIPLALALLSIGVALVWLIWRVLRPAAVAKPVRAPITRAQIEARAEILAPGGALPIVAQELEELDQRATSGELYFALFGEISTGKSSLIAALGAQEVLIDVRGGTTLEAKLYRVEMAPGLRVTLADVPGINEAAGAQRAEIARQEAIRAHAVGLVVDGDLSRSEAEQWQWLKAFAKPMLLILNKTDRYQPAELAQLRARLATRFGSAALEVSAGGVEHYQLEHADGRREARTRARKPQIEALRKQLIDYGRRGAEPLEAMRSHAVLQSLDLKLGEVEQAQRLQRGSEIVRSYTRRAVVGAMAAVAPGTDLVIQGALAVALVRALTELYQVSVRQVDIDDLLNLVGGRLKGSVALLLAIVGNAAKAFPGLGTLGGGALHAIAYGLIFESLGKALLESLDRLGALDRNELLERISTEMRDQSRLLARAAELAKVLLNKS